MDKVSGSVKIIRKEVKKIDEMCEVLNFLKDIPGIGLFNFKNLSVKFKKSEYKVYLQTADNKIKIYTVSRENKELQILKFSTRVNKNLNVGMNRSFQGKIEDIIPKLESCKENLIDGLETEEFRRQKVSELKKALEDAPKNSFKRKQAERNLNDENIKLDKFNKDLNIFSNKIKNGLSYEEINKECKKWNQMGAIEEYINKAENNLKNVKTYRKYREQLRELIRDKKQYSTDLDEKHREKLDNEYNKLMDNLPGNLDGLIDDVKKGIGALMSRNKASEQQLKAAKEIKLMIEGADKDVLQKEFNGCDNNIDMIMERILDMDNKKMHNVMNRIDTAYQEALANKDRGYFDNAMYKGTQSVNKNKIDKTIDRTNNIKSVNENKIDKVSIKSTRYIPKDFVKKVDVKSELANQKRNSVMRRIKNVVKINLTSVLLEQNNNKNKPSKDRTIAGELKHKMGNMIKDISNDINRDIKKEFYDGSEQKKNKNRTMVGKLKHKIKNVTKYINNDIKIGDIGNKIKTNKVERIDNVQKNNDKKKNLDL